MSFSVADYSSDPLPIPLYAYGQSLVPNDGGPNGTGSSATGAVILTELAVGYPDYNTDARAERVYLYSQALQNPTDIGQDAYKMVQSTICVDQPNLLGPGSSCRRFYMGTCETLNATQSYYIYFETRQKVSTSAGGTYDGGSLIHDDMSLDPQETMQFLAAFDDVDS